MLARLAAATALAALPSFSAGAATPFADYCEGNICFQGKVNKSCMTPDALRLLQEIATRFGKIEVASACDGRHARRSAHYVGKAFDFRPYSASRADVVAFLKAAPHVGGVGTYANGLIHADVADRKMAWHGRGRGRVVWPIGAGTIEKTPDEAPVVQASAFSFLNLFSNTPTPSGATGTPASPLPPATGAEPAAAAVGTRTALVPLPPRRPALLQEPTLAETNAPVQVASAEGPIGPMPAFADPGQAMAPARFMAVPGPTSPGPGATPEQARPAATPGMWAEAASASAPIQTISAPRQSGLASAATPTDKGLGADVSLFSSNAFTQYAQTGFTRAASPSFLISSRIAPY